MSDESTLTSTINMDTSQCDSVNSSNNDCASQYSRPSNNSVEDKSDSTAPTTTDVMDSKHNLDSTEMSEKEKTTEREENSDNNSELSTSRELKSLLALSREAKLDTNISRKIKRKSTDNTKKDKDYVYVNSKLKLNKSASKSKKSESRMVKYPVTAESELELDICSENEKNLDIETEDNSVKRKRESLTDSVGGAAEEINKKPKKTLTNEIAMFKPNKDKFCWRCHREGVNIACETCPRSYHQKCLKQTIVDADHWPCPECVSILKAESMHSRSDAMKGMTLEHLCGLLKFAVKRMIECQGSEPFIHPVNDSYFPDYKNYIVQPMDLTLLEKNIKENCYGSPQAFEADAKWILHNSIIFNSYQSKLTYAAKNIVKICKQEMAEIENCPNCYLNANTKKATWFTEVCPKPHLIVWAKLKGFPYWPAKLMICKDGLADVRFFGAHDRAWVPYKDCYLFSLKDPNGFKQRRHDIEQCVDELKVYVDNLTEFYGKFEYAPYKTVIDPENEHKQLKLLLPNFNKKNMSISKTVENKENNSEPNKDETESNTKKDTENNNSDDHKEKNMKKCDSNESIMEGYGTDDEEMSNIDIERRNMLRRTEDLEENDADNKDERVEGEDDDDDTQVSPNSKVSQVDSNVKSQSSPGISKPVPKVKSDDKVPYDGNANSPEKKSRRNSEASVKSDSSHISDKINKVDISENMEVTLGNDNTGCLTISENVSTSQSVSENLENKRKPVLVDIDNEELSITPPTKVKIADKLMKRLSDIDESVSSSSNDSSNEAKKMPSSETKSQTDMLLEQYKKVVQQKVIDFKQNSPQKEASSSVSEATSSKDSQKCPQQSIENKICDTPPKLVKKKLAIPEKIKEIRILEVKTISDSGYSDKTEETLPVDTDEDDLSAPSVQSNVLTESPNKATNKQQQNSEGNTDHEQTNKTTPVKQGSLNTAVNDIPTSNSPKKDLPTASSIKDTLSDGTGNTENQVAAKTSDPSSNRSKPNKKNSITVIEEFADEDEETSSNLDESQIDKDNIINIIHSSLGLSPPRKKLSGDKSCSKVSDVRNEANKKRKVFMDPEKYPSKLMKLVPISDIVKHPSHGKSSEATGSKEPDGNSILLKSLAQPNSAKTVKTPSASSSSEQSFIHEINCDEIKIEPDSEVEYMETENLEAKRQYLSALNISERKETSDSAQSQVRTRSKAEEKRERCKAIDNLSKVIDAVAQNYNATCDEPATAAKKLEKPKSYSSNKKEGEIFVKSFAKMVPKQKARKSFPATKPTYSVIKSPVQSKEINVSKAVGSQPATTSTTSVAQIQSKTAAQPQNQSSSPSILKPAVSAVQSAVLNQPLDTMRANNGFLVLQPQTHEFVLVPTNQPINLHTVANQQPLSKGPVVSSSTVTSWTQSKRPTSICVNASQNYIPQNEEGPSCPTVATASNAKKTNENQPALSNPKDVSSSTPQESEQEPNQDGDQSTEVQEEDEFATLNSILPENVSNTINNLIRKAPPKLKPRPPGMLSTNFAEGTPSSAGNVTARINSISHRLGDYLRGMLIETLEDLGKAHNPEATVTSLKLEIETLKHKHSVELSEIEKNVTTVLRDIQRSIIEDRERIIDETRAACEIEAIKRIEDAKSKQWCANCSKEAQFYCCWNTSYCDYPCQQKHWPQHMGKCTQNLNHTSSNSAVRCSPGQPIILRPAQPPNNKNNMGRFITKPVQKVYMNKNLTPKAVKVQNSPANQMAANQMTVVETSPGNYQLIGSSLSFRPSLVSHAKTSSSSATSSSEKSIINRSLGGVRVPALSNLLEDSD